MKLGCSQVFINFQLLLQQLQLLLLLLVLTTSQTVSALKAPIRINCGSSTPLTDQDGNVWQSDDYFGYNSAGLALNSASWSAESVAGITESDPITGAAAAQLYPMYNTERSFGSKTSTVYQYSIPMSPGSYTVRLHFAEIFPSLAVPGARIFRVSVNGLQAVQLDLAAMVGYRHALVITYSSVVLTSGDLIVSFDKLVQKPKISGIEIVNADATTATTTAQVTTTTIKLTTTTTLSTAPALTTTTAAGTTTTTQATTKVVATTAAAGFTTTRTTTTTTTKPDFTIVVRSDGMYKNFGSFTEAICFQEVE